MSNVERFLWNWSLQFARLASSLIGILTLGIIDTSCKVEGAWLDYMEDKEFGERNQ